LKKGLVLPGGGTDTEQFFRDQRQARFASKHQPEDKEGERFRPMPMHAGEQLAHVGRPLAP
jgi:hypothetical protein